MSADNPDPDLYYGELSVTAEVCVQPFQDIHFKSYHPGFNEGNLPQREREEYSLSTMDGGWDIGCVPSFFTKRWPRGVGVVPIPGMGMRSQISRHDVAFGRLVCDGPIGERR